MTATVSHVSQLHRRIVSIVALRGQQTPVRGEGDDIDSAGVPFERAEQLAASRLPELHRVVRTPAGQRPALRIKRHALDPLRCPSSVRSSLPLRASQSFTVWSSTPAGQRPALRIKRHAQDRVLVPFERAEQLAASRLPELHRVVITPAGQHPALRIKRHATDYVLVPFERAEQLAASRLPELHRVVTHSRWPASRPADQTPRS